MRSTKIILASIREGAGGFSQTHEALGYEFQEIESIALNLVVMGKTEYAPNMFISKDHQYLYKAVVFKHSVGLKGGYGESRDSMSEAIKIAIGHLYLQNGIELGRKAGIYRRLAIMFFIVILLLVVINQVNLAHPPGL